jgi:hypothetical protein
MAEVLVAFDRSRLLSFDCDPATRGPTVEVAHEALLKEWPRLGNWLAGSRADVRLERLFATAAQEWETAGRDPSFLLQGARLAQFEGWAVGSGLALTAAEREFLAASLADRHRREAEEKARRHSPLGHEDWEAHAPA